MKLVKDLAENVKVAKTLIGDSDDVILFPFKIGDDDALAIYIDSITDKNMLGLEVLSPLKKLGEIKTVAVMSKSITTASVTVLDEQYKCAEDVLDGKTVIFFENKKKAFSVDVKKFETRSITEPPTGFSIRGPRSGFVESIKVNLSLVRRYLKTKDLKVENSTVGKYTKTSVSLIYISGIAREGLVEKIREKLSKISVDGVPDSS